MVVMVVSRTREKRVSKEKRGTGKRNVASVSAKKGANSSAAKQKKEKSPGHFMYLIAFFALLASSPNPSHTEVYFMGGA